ncbi:hypothetical protein AWC11_12030 [Mycobacterium interjectum]|nr:hypothetical protein AWC11_12030 [Mycobacterium interjectum]
MTHVQKQFRVDRTWQPDDECVLAVLTDEDGAESFHLFTREWFDGPAADGGRLPRYTLPSHELAGPLPPSWQCRLDAANRKEHQP